MRRFCAVCISIIALALVFGSGRTAKAQQAAPQESITRQILAAYLPVTASLPSDLSPGQVASVPNAVTAAFATDPVEAGKVVARGRLDGVRESFSRSQGPSLGLRLSLFSDSAGAQADLRDPVDLAVQPAGTLLTAPLDSPLLDQSTSYAYTTRAGSEIAGVGLTSGRLEALITELGPAGSVSPGDLLPLVTVVEARLQVPPPAATDIELAIVHAQTGPEAILHDAYRLLLDSYVERLEPVTILGWAYDGAVGALAQADSSELPARPQITTAQPEEAWAKFLSGYQHLESLAGSLSLRDLAYAAATEMYSSRHTNCHTHFMRPAAYSRDIAGTDGEATVGTGLSLVRAAGNHEYIRRVLSGSPAEAGGLLPGDEITAINRQTLAAAGVGFLAPLAGDAGKAVTITIGRPEYPDPFDVTLVLAPVQPVLEQHRILPGGIGYIEFDRFSTGDAGDTLLSRINDALAEFESAGVIGWLLDLRFNPGGNELTLQRIAGLFVPEGSLLITSSWRDRASTTAHSLGAPLADQKPLVILTGAQTASSAEIFAQSLHDLGRATIVGGKTAGCVNGGVRRALLDGSGVFVSDQDVRSGPNRVALEHIGVMPDNPVSYSRTDLINRSDPQLDAAVSLAGGATTVTR